MSRSKGCMADANGCAIIAAAAVVVAVVEQSIVIMISYCSWFLADRTSELHEI